MNSLIAFIVAGVATVFGEVPCGVPEPQATRIVGGKIAKKGAWPWQAGLYLNWDIFCGASILSPTWVLTAAHCVYGSDTSELQILAGEYDLDKWENDKQIRYAKRAFTHPDFDPEVKNNDLALIELTEPFQFTRDIRPVCVPKSHEKVPVGKKCFMSGWGQYTAGRWGPMASILKETALYVVSKEQCSSLNTKNYGTAITDQMLCAGPAPNKKDSGCHGDSGGPFVCQEDDGHWVLQGSVSWGSALCNSRSAYTVFSRNAEFADWINSYVK